MTKRREPEVTVENNILALHDDWLLYLWTNFILDPKDDGKTRFLTVKHLGSCVHRDGDLAWTCLRGGIDDAFYLLRHNTEPLCNSKTYYDSRWWLPALVCKKFYALFRYLDVRHKNTPEIKFPWIRSRLDLPPSWGDHIHTKKTRGLFRTESTLNKYFNDSTEKYIHWAIMIMVTIHNFDPRFPGAKSYLFDFHDLVVGKMKLDVYCNNYNPTYSGVKLLELEYDFTHENIPKAKAMLKLYQCAINKLFFFKPEVVNLAITCVEHTKYGMPKKATKMFEYGDIYE